MARGVRPPTRSKWMTPGTMYQWRRFTLRFEAFCRTCPPGSMAERVQGWLRTLPASQQSAARCALKTSLGKAALDWDGITVTKHRRNDAILQASVLREDQRRQVRAAAQGAKETALVECLWTMRRFEVAALCWRDVDLTQGMAYIRHGKGDKPSWTLLTTEAQTALAAWFTEAGEPSDELPVFQIPHGVGHPKRVGGPYTPGGIGKIVQAILTRAGCWSHGIGNCHRFRRTMASEFIRANPGCLPALQAILRHESPATTMRYVWQRPDDLAPRLARVRL